MNKIYKQRYWTRVSFNRLEMFSTVFVLVLCQVFVGILTTSLPECEKSEYHYEYTECGSDGGRWHVPVPHDANHCAIKTRPPIYQKSCDATCPEGQYSDVSLITETCKPCPIGTHSRGGAVHYTNWTVLPPEFDSYSVKNYDERTQTSEDSECNSTWIADGRYLRTDGTSCVTRLTYSTDIINDEGTLTFWYYYTNDNSNLYFEVFVKNEQCEISKQRDEDDDDDDDGDSDEEDNEYEDMSNSDDEDYENPSPSSDYKWKNFTLMLKRGKNLVVWQVEHWDRAKGTKIGNMIFIRDIEVKGTSASSECAPCDAGKFADKEGSAWCKSCPENFISDAGASKCTSCNEKTEYSLRGSSTCRKRPPCNETDYIETSSVCDKNNKFQTVYKWIEPKICSDVISGAVKLPSPGPEQDCPPCNPGMYLNDTKCLFCPKGQMSDGQKPCVPCIPSTGPELNHDYHTWRSWPTTTEHWCSSYVEGCSTPAGWQLRGHFLESGLGHSDDVTLHFEVKTEGFAGERGLVSRTANAVGKVRIDFELDCDGPCVFTMYERKGGDFSYGLERINEWHGREPRQNYSYAVTSKGPMTYRWAFKKAKSESITHGFNKKTFQYIKDRVKIYAIYLSNTLDGGASFCRACLVGFQKSGCIECPEGHYINKNTKKCQPCPKDTYLSNHTCHKCGPGLTSKKGSTKCYSSCLYRTKDGRDIDFSSLKGVHSAQTQKSFFGEGTAFTYEYRINLCGVGAPPASCHSNATTVWNRHSAKYLNASICQMRIIPGKDDAPSRATTVASIGHQLMGVYEDKPENVSLDVFLDEKLTNESLLYFDYLSHSVTPSCPNGRSAWVILRCDSNADKEGFITFPQKCHEGTCDGCQFLFLWHTKYACPMCTDDHYYEIEGGCVNSQKKIHYTWKTTPKDCVGGVSLPSTKKLKCSDMSVHEAVKQFQILIGIVAFVLTAIIASLFFLWYKNRVLKYKLYHRVAVNESNQNENELPVAESCMPDDDEDDESGEKVEFKKGENPGKKLLKKLKDMRSDKHDEGMRLSDSFEVDLN